MVTGTLPHYRYRGARALVTLHEKQLRSFTLVWREADKISVELPETGDTAYESMKSLLRHVLDWSGRYLVWCCDVVGLGDPEIPAIPASIANEAQLDCYVEALLEKWRSPLSSVEREKFVKPEHLSPWGVYYCVDAMLEHAVMHPLRHELQLWELIREHRAV